MSFNILLFQRILPSYRVAVFKRLYHEFGIICCHSKQYKSSNVSSALHEIDFPHELLSGFHYKKSPTAVVQNPLKVLRKYKPRIVITEGSSSYFTLWILFLLKPFFRYKIIIWTHGIKNKELDHPFSSRSTRLGLYNFNRADAILLYSQGRKDILSHYIKSNEKLFVAWNTLDTHRLSSLYQQFKSLGKEKIKNELGISSEYILIFIGRILKSKGLDKLFEAFQHISPSLDVHLYIIGDGPDKRYFEGIGRNSGNISFLGPIYDDELTGKFLFVSDLMIMPGYVGLSVVHAFAFGCPVLTCKGDPEKGPFHSPEIEYIKDSYNGYIVKNSVEAIWQKVEEHLKNNRIEMKENCITSIQYEASLDRMLEGFKNIISYLT